MKASHESLEGLLEKYEEQLEGLNSYIKELTTITAKLGTPAEQFKDDLIEAENNAKFYEGKIAVIKKEGGWSVKAGPSQPGADTILPHTAKRGIGSIIFSSISFVAGALLGSRLRSRRESKDRPGGKG